MIIPIGAQPVRAGPMQKLVRVTRHGSTRSSKRSCYR
jgi:hypothetical protein